MNYATQRQSQNDVNSQKQKILDYIEENGHITDAEIQNILELKKTRAFTLAKQLRDEGLIIAVGRGSGKKYVKAY